VREADNLSASSADVKNAWSYTDTPPIRLHGVVICTGTTLPLPFTIDGGYVGKITAYIGYLK
jgi:hypothetical protein